MNVKMNGKKKMENEDGKEHGKTDGTIIWKKEDGNMEK